MNKFLWDPKYSSFILHANTKKNTSIEKKIISSTKLTTISRVERYSFDLNSFCTAHIEAWIKASRTRYKSRERTPFRMLIVDILPGPRMTNKLKDDAAVMQGGAWVGKKYLYLENVTRIKESFV
jgi:hypothetical protein